MKETGLTGKRRPTTIAATPDDGRSQRKRRRRKNNLSKGFKNSPFFWADIVALIMRCGVYSGKPVVFSIGITRKKL